MSKVVSIVMSWRYFLCHSAATSLIYTLSLHDALPIFLPVFWAAWKWTGDQKYLAPFRHQGARALESIPADRKSTRLNSSHRTISYAVFCLKKKKTTPTAPISKDQPVITREEVLIIRQP